jgi:hypothetical protein
MPAPARYGDNVAGSLAPELPEPLDGPARALIEATEGASRLETPGTEHLIAQLREAIEATFVAARQLADNRPSPAALSAWSHRVREPLTVVVAWVQMLSKATLDDAMLTRGRESIERNVRMYIQRLGDVPQ